MNFLLENFQVVIIVAAIIFSGLQKLWEMKRNREQEQPWQPRDKDFHPVEEDFQPAPPRADLPRRKPAVPPPLARYIPAEEPELERQRKMQERLKALRDSQKATSAAAKTLAKKKTRATGPVASPSKLRDRLRDPKEVRQAIVMREILGPPVGLR
jgi:type IV secretory pathway VirB10-like protein